MFIAVLCVKNVPGFKWINDDLVALLGVHFDFTVQHNEHFRSVVNMPFVGLIGPMKPYRSCACDCFNHQCIPCPGSGEIPR